MEILGQKSSQHYELFKRTKCTCVGKTKPWVKPLSKLWWKKLQSISPPTSLNLSRWITHIMKKQHKHTTSPHLVWRPPSHTFEDYNEALIFTTMILVGYFKQADDLKNCLRISSRVCMSVLYMYEYISDEKCSAIKNKLKALCNLNVQYNVSSVLSEWDYYIE